MIKSMLSAEILIVGACLAAGATYVTNWLALIPWRRSKGQHWSEQARLAFPVFVAARSNLLAVPGIITLTVFLLWPDSSPLWFFAGIISMLGAYAGTLPLDREVFPRIFLPELLRQAVIGMLLKSLILFVFIGATVWMPQEFNQMTFAICALVLILSVVWSRGGLVWLGRKLGLFVPAPARLHMIVAETSNRMQVPFCEILLIRSPVAQAFALLQTRQLWFTERLLEIAPDDEVAAICAHELAHLTESRAARYSRSVRMLMFLPWILFNPLTHAFGIFAFFGLLIVTLAVPRLHRQISRKLEARADQMAKANEGDSGTYARALTRLYEDNLAPAVSAKERASHPHLYDRLLAAGVTPDFPRPAPAKAMAWNGSLFAGVVGILFAIFAMRLLPLHFGAG